MHQNKFYYMKPKKAPLLRVTIVGDSMSGKSKLCHRYFHNQYDDNYSETILSSNSSLSIEKNRKIFSVQVYDVSGGFRFQDIIYKDYYKGTSLFVVTIPADCRNFQENIINWYTSIVNNFGQNASCRFLFVLTKIDLIPVGEREALEKEFVKSIKNARQDVINKKYEMIRFFDETGYICTSAKDNINIKELFSKIGELMLELIPQKDLVPSEPNIRRDLTPYYFVLEELWKNTEGTWFDKVRALLSDYLTIVKLSFPFFHVRHHKAEVDSIYHKTLSALGDFEIYEALFNITRLTDYNYKGDFAMLFEVVKRHSKELDKRLIEAHEQVTINRTYLY